MNEDEPSNETGRPGAEDPVFDDEHRSITPHVDDSPHINAAVGCGKSWVMIARVQKYIDCPERYPLDSCQTESEPDSTDNVK